jgi:FdhD protein
VNPETILEMVRELSKRSKIHMSTGGTHAAMLCSKEGKVLAFAEDVGRHNAIDKVVGSMLLNERTLLDCILISSGRQSGEMVQKAVQAQIPIVASMTAPLSSGIKLADLAGITLVCFARGTRLQIYTFPQRIEHKP